MRPFSIMVANNLTTSPAGDLPENYFVGYRTLVLYGIADIEDSDEINSKAHSIINSMVLSKIKANESLKNRFAAVSKDLATYWTMWSELNCPIMSQSQVNTYMQYFFPEAPYKGYDRWGYDFIENMIERYGMTREEAEQLRRDAIMDMGNYGYICGSLASSTVFSPQEDEDLEQFVAAALSMGKDLFTERFGACPLVMTKFNMIYEYITTELGLEL